MSYVNPHSFRNTLVRLGEQLCRTPEQWKSFSQNLGHEHEATTFSGYGKVPEHRQAELSRQLGAPTPPDIQGLDIAGLENFVASARRRSERSPGG